MTTDVLLAPDKFKGSLSAGDVADALRIGLNKAAPGVRVVAVPIADGGDGTLEAVISAGYRHVPVTATGPTGEPVESGYAERDGVAVVELADACGLNRLPAGQPAPLTATSTGFGQVIAAALDAGCRAVILAVGGSASTDGGAGMLSALGVRILDAFGVEVPAGGGHLDRLDRVDLTGLHPAVAETHFVLASDVDNPLLGQHGAAAVYGPQKGASPADVVLLDHGLRRWSITVADALGFPASSGGHPAAALASSGAAGGVGFGAMAVLRAEPRSGVELLLEITGFFRQLSTAGLVITGEGSLDSQTLRGKAPAGVAAAARSAGVPVIAVAGRNLLTEEQQKAAGIEAVYSLLDLDSDVGRCMAQAGSLLQRLAHRIARDWLTGT